jgi:hypothetical protein
MPRQRSVRCGVRPHFNDTLVHDSEIELIIIVPFTDSIGTCSMLPREKHGVVDPDLKVSQAVQIISL